MSKREILAHALERSGLGWILRRLGTWNGLLVLNYHRVGDWQNSPWDKDLFSASAQDFDAQLQFFKTEFDFVSDADLDLIKGRPGRYVQVTFDDGYRDNHDIAFPILKSHGLSASFFVCSGFVDHGGVPWWDEMAWLIRQSPLDKLEPFRQVPALSLAGGKRLTAVRRVNDIYDALSDTDRVGFLDDLARACHMPRCSPQEASSLWMTWDMVRAMHRAGMTIGGHTLNHVELSRLKQDAQLNEITGSCARIAQEIGAPVRTFSYPYGTRTAFNDDTRAALAAAGIRYGYSYYGGYQSPHNWDNYNIKRVPVELHVSQPLLHAVATLPQIMA